MDLQEKLKVAKSRKEEGNDYFKKGMLPEAQKAYTEVLHMLREEISFTGDYQEERKALILAAHLNLAQCALQLGGYAKVIDHCNTALELDSNNLKAYFRRAKAFENLSEYAKALEGYQTVLRLEPDNSVVQKQQRECQKKFAKDRSTEQMSDNTGVIEVEMVHESCEGEFESFYKRCKKNPGHKEFIDVTDFRVNHLPPGYRDQGLFDFLKHKIRLTVLVEVRGSSEHRPDYDPESGDKYPFSGKRYRRTIHRGTGSVLFVIPNIEDKPCPCPTCQSSKFPEKRWGQICVSTARHVVYDEIEARNTTCYFFYHTGKQLKLCSKIYNGLEGRRTHLDDSSLMFFSHDQELLDILCEECKLYEASLYEIRTKYNNESSVKEGTDMLDKFMQHLRRADELLTEFRDVKDRLMAICNADPETEYQRCLEKQRKTGVSGRLGCLLLDKLKGGSELQHIMKDILLMYESYESRVVENKTVWFAINEIQRGHLALTEERGRGLKAEDRDLDILVKETEKLLNFSRSVLADDEDCPDHRLDDYDNVYPLTIIVSHPHGCSKKISVGEVTDRAVHHSHKNLARFIYSTPTCPGSSGAAVFILGRTGSYTDPTHSCGQSVETGGRQRNMSVFNWELSSVSAGSERQHKIGHYMG